MKPARSPPRPLRKQKLNPQGLRRAVLSSFLTRPITSGCSAYHRSHPLIMTPLLHALWPDRILDWSSRRPDTRVCVWRAVVGFNYTQSILWIIRFTCTSIVSPLPSRYEVKEPLLFCILFSEQFIVSQRRTPKLCGKNGGGWVFGPILYVL